MSNTHTCIFTTKFTTDLRYYLHILDYQKWQNSYLMRIVWCFCSLNCYGISRWGVANIRRKLTIYSGFILLESLVSFSIVCVVAGIFSLTITQLIQQNYQREQELTRTRLGYEAILFLEQTGDLRFKERIYQGETYRFSLMENEGRRILKVTDSRGAILIGQ